MTLALDQHIQFYLQISIADYFDSITHGLSVVFFCQRVGFLPVKSASASSAPFHTLYRYLLNLQSLTVIRCQREALSAIAFGLRIFGIKTSLFLPANCGKVRVLELSIRRAGPWQGWL